MVHYLNSNFYRGFFKMNRIFASFLMLTGVAISGAEWKDISYYEKNAPAQGNVEYRNERCKLDLKTPDKRVKFPTLVYFHGGGLKAGGKSTLPIIDTQFVATATVNYRLSGERASCPDYIYDAAAAVAWVIKNIEKFGGDPGQVYVSGQSAGGYLTAMICLDKRYLENFGIAYLRHVKTGSNLPRAHAIVPITV